MPDGVEIAVDGQTEGEHQDDDAEECDRSAALAEVEVAASWNEVREHHRRDRARLHDPAKSFRTFLKWGSSLSNVTVSSSGTSRVRAVTVMKFESPLHRGTMCR